MDKKIKLLVITSLVAVMATGCSRFRGGGNTADGDAFEGGGSSQASGGSQVRSDGGSRRGLFSQQRASTCAPCAANATRSKANAQAPRVYKPAAPKPYRAPAAATRPYRPAGQHSQQWYLDRWKRQQQQGQARPRAQQQNTNYDTGSNATYYDYSSAGKTNNTGAAANTRTSTTNVSTSNKSIYTGSYQQKTYKPYNPTTYSGGSSASTNTNTTYVSNANSGKSNGKTYIVKKGDTVFEIMRQTGVYWKDIIKLNNLQAPAYTISPGQAIRLK